MKPEVGIHTGVPFDEYVKWDALSASMLKHFRKSPAHYKHALENPLEKTTAMTWGSLVHCLVFEPEEVFERFALLPDGNYQLKDMKALKLQVIAENPGRELVKQSDFDGACEAAKRVVSHRSASPFLSTADKEVSFVWESHGVLCKGRADCLSREKNILLDLKTTPSADEESFARTIAMRGYHYQAGWYRDGLRKLGVDITSFVFIACENEAPFGVRVYEMDPDVMDKAMKKTAGYLHMYKRCVDTDSWDSYPTTIDVIGIPRWADEAEFGLTVEA